MTEPIVSVLLIVYKMPRQALNTLQTLSPQYQRGVSADDYEVIVVENRSDEVMDANAVRGVAPNIRYFLRDESGVSPASAINRAIAESRAPFIGIMIDGARMVTPGVMRNVLDVFRMDPDALIATLGYHLGPQDHRLDPRGHDEATERELLGTLPYAGDGYGLFDISCISMGNEYGAAHPLMESNCMFVHRKHLDRIGGADERFIQLGGGMMNLDIYRQLAELRDTTLWLLPGEGSFHQLHGGVTTQHDQDREPLMAAFRAEYEGIRGKKFLSPIPEPNYFGEIPPNAMPVLRYSAQAGIARFVKRTGRDQPVWANEVTRPLSAPELVAELGAEQMTPDKTENARLPQVSISPPQEPNRIRKQRLRRRAAKLLRRAPR